MWIIKWTEDIELDSAGLAAAASIYTTTHYPTTWPSKRTGETWVRLSLVTLTMNKKKPARYLRFLWYFLIYTRDCRVSGAPPPPPNIESLRVPPPPPNLKVAPRSLTYQANRWRIGHEKRVMPITMSKLVIRKKTPVIDYFLKSTAKSRQIETVQMQSNLLTPFYDSSSTVAYTFTKKHMRLSV